jgi:hypothetical protein
MHRLFSTFVLPFVEVSFEREVSFFVLFHQIIELGLKSLNSRPRMVNLQVIFFVTVNFAIKVGLELTAVIIRKVIILKTASAVKRVIDQLNLCLEHLHLLYRMDYNSSQLLRLRLIAFVSLIVYDLLYL